jgi:leader peptidase (prepilin peptidase) / N-methyltransferase
VNAGIVAIVAVLGLFVGSAAWVVARNQATHRPLWGPPRCETDLAVSFSKPKTAPAETTVADREATLPPAGGGSCGAPLPASAWLPFWGFLAARRCPTCGTEQSPWRVVAELLTALYFGLAAWRIDDGLHLAAVLVFSVPLIVVFLVDAWTRLIYTNVIYAGTALGLLFALVEDGFGGLLKTVLAIVAAVAIFAVFYFIAMVLYRNVRVVPFGKGDVYLAAMIASMVRLDGLLRALFLGILLAAAGALLLIATRRVGRRQAMPYGPYLCLGALIALIW